MSSLPEKYKTPYNSKDIESPIYELEVSSGLFNPDTLIDKYPKKYSNSKTWTTITPPPNANGRLHAGHALDVFKFSCYLVLTMRVLKHRLCMKKN
jgi:valyl-tRNA synthetase